LIAEVGVFCRSLKPAELFEHHLARMLRLHPVLQKIRASRESQHEANYNEQAPRWATFSSGEFHSQNPLIPFGVQPGGYDQR
jgi:hypothetical protein